MSNNCTPGVVPDALIGGNTSTEILYPNRSAAEFVLRSYCFSFTGHQPFACANYPIWDEGDVISWSTNYSGNYSACTSKP